MLGASVGTVGVILAYAEAIKGVSSARKQFDVKPPCSEGPEGFQCAMRAQQNTLEFMVIVVPLIWMTAALLPFGGLASAVLGLAWAYAPSSCNSMQCLQLQKNVFFQQ